MNESLIVALSGIAGTVVVVLSFFRGRNTEAITEVSAIWEELDRLKQESKDQQRESRQQQATLRVMNDYIVLLRKMMEANGMHVPPWPDPLTKDFT